MIDFSTQSTDESGCPPLSAHSGEAPGNFLAALRAYGRSAALLGKVGDDAFGRLLLHTLADAGIEARGVQVDPSLFTALAFVPPNPQTGRSGSTGKVKKPLPPGDAAKRQGQLF